MPPSSPLRLLVAASTPLLAAALNIPPSPPPEPASPPSNPGIFPNKLSDSLIVMIVLCMLVMCCGCVFVFAHVCGWGRTLSGAAGSGPFGSFFYGPNNDGRGAAGLKAYRSKEDAAEALGVLAERYRRAAVWLLIFSIVRILSLHGMCGIIASVAILCYASPPGIKGLINSVKCARCCAIIAAVIAAFAVCGSIALAVFAVNANEGFKSACDAVEGTDYTNITITEGPLDGETYDTTGVDLCGWFLDMLKHAIAWCFTLLIIPDFGILCSSIAVAHFGKVLETLSLAVGPLEASPLLYR